MTVWLSWGRSLRQGPLDGGGDVLQPFCTAVIERTVPGRIYVDDAERPQMAFISRQDPWSSPGGSRRRRLVRNPTRRGDGWRDGRHASPVDHISAGGLGRCGPGDLPDRPPVVTPRRHYVCCGTDFDWEATTPEGIEIRLMDGSLLSWRCRATGGGARDAGAVAGIRVVGARRLWLCCHRHDGGPTTGRSWRQWTVLWAAQVTWGCSR